MPKFSRGSYQVMVERNADHIWQTNYWLQIPSYAKENGNLIFLKNHVKVHTTTYIISSFIIHTHLGIITLWVKVEYAFVFVLFFHIWLEFHSPWIIFDFYDNILQIEKNAPNRTSYLFLCHWKLHYSLASRRQNEMTKNYSMLLKK